MKIKSKSHAMELIGDLVKQGFMDYTWLTSELPNGKVKLTKIWKWKTKTQDGITK